MCNFVVAMLVERYLVTNFEFNPEHVLNRLLLMTLEKVECTGPKQAACRYEAISVFVSLFSNYH